jgi:hypothetical protein
MNSQNNYLFGFLIVIGIFLTFIFPEINNFYRNLFGANNSEQANKYAEFATLVTSAGSMYLIMNWFSGKYR